MSSPCAIFSATARDVEELSILVGELLDEIVAATGVDPFGFDLAETSGRLQDFIDRGKYFVFLARAEQGRMAGFISIYESHALYAQGNSARLPNSTCDRNTARAGWALP